MHIFISHKTFSVVFFTGIFLMLFIVSEAKAIDVVNIEKKVVQLINETTTTPERQEKAFEILEEMGDEAIPYIIKNMLDMRKLAIPEISFANHAPSAFEKRAYYGAEFVHDALSILLYQSTGQSFGFEINGATLEKRQANRNLWVAWCRKRYASRADMCGN